jgi:HD domain
MQDKYRNRYRMPKATNRLRLQIAIEAARRLYPSIAPKDDESARGWLDAAGANDLYVAKRKAAAVLGHRIRPGDLPSDDEVREQLVVLWRESTGVGVPAGTEETEPLDDEADAGVAAMADHLDRFAIYRMRLGPLESVKQNARSHPEGDALYHSLQVFELARDVRPYDEEFLLAALLHDVGKAIDAQDHVRAGVESLRGAVTERTLWLIEHHMDLLSVRERAISPRLRRELESSEYYDDLKLLRELNDAGRVPGQPVESLDEALAYIRGLETESYLDDGSPPIGQGG